MPTPLLPRQNTSDDQSAVLTIIAAALALLLVLAEAHARGVLDLPFLSGSTESETPSANPP